MTANLPFTYPVVPTSGKGRGIFRPRARYFPGMESTQRSPGLRTRTRSARLENGLNLFGAGMNFGPLRPPPAAARAGQIRCPSFSTLRLSCALPFRLRLLRSSHHVGPDALIGPRKSGAPQSPLIRPCGPPSPLWGEGFLGCPYGVVTKPASPGFCGPIGCVAAFVGPGDPYPLWPPAISP